MSVMYTVVLLNVVLIAAIKGSVGAGAGGSRTELIRMDALTALSSGRLSTMVAQ